jgi:hypothetical protein
MRCEKCFQLFELVNCNHDIQIEANQWLYLSIDCLTINHAIADPL